MNVMSDPTLGYSDVSLSRLIALLEACQINWYSNTIRLESHTDLQQPPNTIPSTDDQSTKTGQDSVSIMRVRGKLWRMKEGRHRRVRQAPATWYETVACATPVDATCTQTTTTEQLLAT